MATGWESIGGQPRLAGTREGCSETEALAIAIQDKVVHTRAYRKGVMKDRDLPDDLCRFCGDAPEMVGHLLAACEDLHWNLHKERHDRVVYQILLALLEQFNLTQPDSLKWHSGGWNGVGVVEGLGVKVEVDLSHPTEAQIESRRPDIVVTLESRVWIIEVACAWDGIVQEREVEKRRKYRPLAANLGSQHPTKRVCSVALVMGDLGTILSFRDELKRLEIFTSWRIDNILKECQHKVLASAVRIIRRTLSS